MIASHTTLPVIGVPVKTTALQGIDSLLSIVQMPKGIPVATVAIDNAANAGLLALRILALADQSLTEQLKLQKQAMAEASRVKTARLKP
jgi:phosphoribosylaminoimidazole carboxylase PurE protein